MLELIDGRLYRTVAIPRRVTAPYVYYLGATRLRLEVIWHLAFGEWPQGHVESIDDSDRPSSLRIVPIPEKFRGKFVK